MVSLSPLQRARNTEQKQHSRQPNQNDTTEEDQPLEVLFVHADRPGPMNPLKESDSEAQQLRHSDRHSEQSQTCEREQQHARHLRVSQLLQVRVVLHTSKAVQGVGMRCSSPIPPSPILAVTS